MRRDFRSVLAAAVSALVLSVSSGISAQAAMTDSGVYAKETVNGIQYYHVSAPACDDEETSLLITMSENDPAVCPTSLNSIWHVDGRLCIREDEFNRLSDIEELCESFVDANLQEIIPEGTPMAEVPETAARWEASVMTYDRESLSDSAKLRAYQNAASCFTEGKGICATYATAFNTLVQSAPLDPATGLVSYACETPVHFKTRYVYNSSHAWSAVSSDGGATWHFYDVTFYDGDGRGDRPQYLDMGAEEMGDGYHSSWHPFS